MGKLFLLCATTVSFSLWGSGESHLTWKSTYQEAREESKSTSKPIVLFFTGSDWCGWCHKLEKEVLNTPEFAELVGKDFIFVTVDFPLYKPSDPKIAEVNKQLQKKFDVKGFPTLVLVDKDEGRIGVTGYRPGGAKAYAEHLMKMVSDYSQYKQKVSSLNTEKGNPLSSSEMKSLYKKAVELSRHEEAATLIHAGLQAEDNGFFLLERFRELALGGNIDGAESVSLKKKIIALDPHNESHYHYEMALVEFESYPEEISHDTYSPEIAVEPLVNYIQKFGKRDKENVWRLQMIISQAYLDKNNLQQALDYARASYETAPETIKSEIAIAVKNMQTEIKK